MGLLSFVLLVALPPLFGGELYKPYMNEAYMGLGFGVVAFLGLLVYMFYLKKKVKEGALSATLR